MGFLHLTAFSIFASEHNVEKKKRKASDISVFDHVNRSQLVEQADQAVQRRGGARPRTAPLPEARQRRPAVRESVLTAHGLTRAPLVPRASCLHGCIWMCMHARHSYACAMCACMLC